MAKTTKKQKQAAAAEATYRAELATHIGSGWAMHGLSEALEAQGKRADMEQAKKTLTLSWAAADPELRGF